MIAGLDSSLARPAAAQILAAHAAGVRLWSGYLATRPGVGLLSPWDRASFELARQLGGKPLAMASGWDDPAALRDLAAAWDVRLCLDCEDGIRGFGPWTEGWLQVSGAGLYGNADVHVVPAVFHVLADYPGFDPMDTWKRVSTVPQPGGPLAWQWQGTHTEFGLSVDRGWYDDWFLSGGDAMTDDQIAERVVDWYAVYLNAWAGPETSDWPYVLQWVEVFKLQGAVEARRQFGIAAAADARGGANIFPVRHFELDAALAGLKPPGPPVPGEPGPFHLHDEEVTVDGAPVKIGRTGGPLGVGA